ncbi:MAG TPA: HAD family phosphatase [Bacteroidales bacterium]|jgi:HAD superfamily hydrolase (TIGR01509 family)|nr:HAD family phosphatase [Bacteroidales bacterium]MDI9553644.1 HAD family phosphatase [Bacteroidota bacterium]MBP7037888.1 HAD family phosphatase [Bacteroidales bacterium]NLK53564.1 HAD family phosphatase [Bacteroidales bacterium]HNY52544.1 HAD family phosphatase [Bacteroidales bacterium]
MIKNIVFDLGNVLLSFVPSEYLIKKNYPDNIRNTILRDIFQSTEWKMLDNGDITVPEAIESIAAKSSLKREEIALVFNFRRDIMFPLDDNAKLLPELRKQGYKLYYLSNFPLDVFQEIKNDFYFFRHFDGGIISAEVRLSKPDIRFYEYLIGKYSLNPSESLFIDDVEENVRAAEKAGMKAMFTDGSLNIAEQLKKKLAGGMA